MKQAYEALPDVGPSAKKPEVVPLLFEQEHMDMARMMKLMAVDGHDGPLPLYLEVQFSSSS